MPISLQSYVTSGLYPNLPNFAPLLAGGAPIILNPTPKFNPSEQPATFGLTTNLNLSPQQLSDLSGISTIRDISGRVVVPGSDGFLDIGDGHTLEFDPDTLQGRITPALEVPGANIDSLLQTYTGADCRLLIECAEASLDGRRYSKQLLEASTLSVSVHREVSPVRAGGYINPKGFALGKRTIAGTLVMTQGTIDVFMRFLQAVMLTDGSKDTFFSKVDQLPPFNITMILTNEAGFASHRKLLGVKFVTDGVVYSIQDMIVEQVVSWIATDFTPLMPLTANGIFLPADQMDRTTRREKTPTDFMESGN